MNLCIVYDAGQEPGSTLGRRQEEHLVAVERHRLARQHLRAARELEEETRRMVALTAQALRGGGR